MLPTQEQVEEYLTSLSDYVSQIPAHIPNFSELGEKILEDIRRFGPLPSLPSVSNVPGLGAFEVPAPPPLPPPPPEVAWYEGKRGWIAAAVAIGTIGAGLTLGSAWRHQHRRKRFQGERAPPRREVIVVLGADTLAGPALVRSLEKQGYVIIASATTSDAAEALEKRSKGFVKALVLNPRDSATVLHFIHSMHTAMSLRYPLNVAGDPYLPSATASHINILVSVISLLSLSPSPPPTPIERLDLPHTYLPTLYETQLAPLAVIQAILPQLRVASSRQGRKGRTTVIVAVPAVASRIGLPFDGAKAMAVAGLVKGIEVLRREVGKDPQVVLIDVGSLSADPKDSVDTEQTRKPDLDIVALTKAWSTSERSAYGHAYEAAVVRAIEGPQRHKKRSRRTPEDVQVFVDAVLGVVHAGRPWTVYRLSETWARIRAWWRGHRFGVGAGAHTYAAASWLPSMVLEALLNLPGWLVALRNRLLPMPPPPVHPVSQPRKILREPKLVEGVDEEKSLTEASSRVASQKSDSRPTSIGSLEHLEEVHEHMTESFVSETPSGAEGTEKMGESWISLGRDAPSHGQGPSS